MNNHIEFPNNLVTYVNRYYREHVQPMKDEAHKKWETILIYKGVDIFLKFLNSSLKERFYLSLDPEIMSVRRDFLHNEKDKELGSDYMQQAKKFVDGLKEERGAKIFIGKDAYLLYHIYRVAYPTSKDAFYIPYSRKYLFNISNGNGYFEIVDLIYKTALKSTHIDDFLKQFKQNLRAHEQLYYTIKSRSLKMLTDYHLLVGLQQFDRVTVVDSGTQGGLIFPLLTVLTDEGFSCGFKIYSCFNWVYPLFKRHIFTKDLYSFIHIEHAGANLYYKSQE